jgi:hypothetical protein
MLIAWASSAISAGDEPILDQLSVSAAAAYSLRQVRSGAALAIRVRRSSDNAEANIGFATAAQTRTNLAAIPINNNGGSTAPGVTMTTVGTGTEFGQPYVEVRWQGTASAAGFLQLVHGAVGAFDPAIHAPVTPGLTYTTSIGFRLVSGTAPSGSVVIRGVQRNNVGAFVYGGTGLNLGLLTSTLQRSAVIETAAATAAFIQPNLYMSVNNGEVVDVTIRFYTVNVEQAVGNARPLLQRNVPEVVADVGDLDAAALLTFVGSGNGFVTTWYDQSGNGSNATQATAGSQPRIVSNGVLHTLGGRPTIRSFGVTEQLFFTSAALGSATAFSFNAVSTVGANGSRKSAVLFGSGFGSPPGPTAGIRWGLFGQGNLSEYGIGWAGVDGNTGLGNGNLVAPSTNYVQTFLKSSTAWNYYQNGGLASANISDTTSPTSEFRGVIFSEGTATYNSNANCSELISIPSVLSTTDRQTLERNEGAYYSITVA